MMNADDDAQLDETIDNADLTGKQQSNKINDAFGLTKESASTKSIPTFNPSNIKNPFLTTNLTTQNINFFNITTSNPILPLNDQIKTQTESIKSTKIDASSNLLENRSNKSSDNLLGLKQDSIPPTNLISPPSFLPLNPLTSPLPVNYNIPLVKKPSQERVQVLQPPTVANNATTNTTTITTTAITPPTFTSVLPPPTTSQIRSSNPSVNPYSAKGALNKKIYEPIQSVAVQPPKSVLTQIVPDSQPHANIYVPPVIDNSQINRSLTPNFSNLNITTEQSNETIKINQYVDIQQPQIQSDIPITPNIIQPTTTTIPDQNVKQQKNVWNWLTHNRIVNSFKSGVESVITTMDPQMKDYMHCINEHLYILNTNGDKILSDLIKSAFNLAGFLRLTIYEYESKTQTQFASQIVGYNCALQSINEKLFNSQQYIQQRCLLIATQRFLVELGQDCWYDQICITLKDTQHNIDATVYTEAIPVPLEYINQLKHSTPENYPLNSSGFSCDLKNNLNINWYEVNYGIQENVLISNSLKSLVSIFKNKFMNVSNN